MSLIQVRNVPCSYCVVCHRPTMKEIYDYEVINILVDKIIYTATCRSNGCQYDRCHVSSVHVTRS